MILNKPVSRRTGEPGNNLYELIATNNTHSFSNTNGSETCMCQTNTGRLLWVRESTAVYKSDDAGTTWSLLSYTSGNCRNIMNTRSGKIYIRTESGVYYSTDDGATWTSLSLDPGGNSYTHYFLKQAYGKYWYFFMKRVGSGSGSSRYYKLYYSEDGDSWTYLVSRTGSSCPFCLTPSGKFIVGGVSSNDNMIIYQSLEQVGTESNPINIGPSDGVPSSQNTANYLILDAPSTPLGYTIWKGNWYSNDDGATWSSNSYFCTYHNGPVLAQGTNTDVTSYPTEVYCKTSTGRIFGRLYAGSTLLYSDDNGVNWYEASTLNTNPLTFMCITNDDVVYAKYSQFNEDMQDNIYIVCKTTPVYTTEYVAMYDSIPVTGKEAKEYVRQFKAYVQSLKT